MFYYGLWRHAFTYKFTTVSEKSATSIFRVEKRSRKFIWIIIIFDIQYAFWVNSGFRNVSVPSSWPLKIGPSLSGNVDLNYHFTNPEEGRSQYVLTCKLNSTAVSNKAKKRKQNKKLDFLISNFRRVLNVVRFLLGNSPASEFYIPTFRNTLPVPSS